MKIESTPMGDMLVSCGNIVSVYIPEDNTVYESGNTHPTQHEEIEEFFKQTAGEGSGIGRDKDAFHFLDALLRVKQAGKQE